MNLLPCISLLIGEASPGVAAWQENDIVAALLILVLGMALGIGLICFLLVLHYMRSGRLSGRNGWLPLPDLSDRRAQTSIYSSPQRWLAVRSGNPYVVQAALGLHKAIPCSWEEGLNVAHDRRLFISPCIGGWVLVMGSHLPDPSDDIDKCFGFLADLSRKLGQVQFFSLNRVVNHHAWVQMQHGQVQRAYAWAGKTVWNQGRKTPAETELALRCFDYSQFPAPKNFSESDPLQQNTERVSLLARRWSLDPAAVDPRRLKESPGISGEVFRSKTH